MIRQIFVAFVLALTCGACNTSMNKNSESVRTKDSGTLVADTILYPVDIKNLDSTNTWADSRLKNLQHKKLTDLIFEALYNGKATAYDYYTHKPVHIEDIKKMEASGEFNRQEMAQLQFEESWFFNPENATMTKQVLSILLAWPVYDNQGVFQAYKAGFVVKLKP
jgi:hypothetical protein